MQLWLMGSAARSPEVIISQKAHNLMLRHRQLDSDTESGGILIGHYYPNAHTLHICVASRPCNQDRRGRYFFHRDAAHATKVARRYWAQSGGALHYLGEWHTHPEPNPSPSFVDRLSMRGLLKNSTVVSSGLVLVIVGQGGTWAGFFTGRGYTTINMVVDESV